MSSDVFSIPAIMYLVTMYQMSLTNQITDTDVGAMNGVALRDSQTEVNGGSGDQ